MIVVGCCRVVVDSITVQLTNGSVLFGTFECVEFLEPDLLRLDGTEQVEHVPDDTDGVLVRLCLCLR
jgi:hypothetical protein